MRYQLSFVHTVTVLPQWETKERSRGGEIDADRAMKDFASQLERSERLANHGYTHGELYDREQISYGTYAAAAARQQKPLDKARGEIDRYNASRSYTVTQCRYVKAAINTLGVLLRNAEGRLVCAAAYTNGLEGHMLEYVLKERMSQSMPKDQQEAVLSALTGTVISDNTNFGIRTETQAAASMMRYVVWNYGHDLTPYDPLALKHEALSDGAFRYWHKVRYQYLRAQG